MFSYSKVDCFKQCPYKYDLRYNKKLQVLPAQNADNALYIGSGLHKGIETTPEQGVLEYQSNYYVLTNEVVNWSIQIEYWAEKVKNLLPSDGKHEVEIKTKDYVGYIDYLTKDTIYDFKFTVPKNYSRYLESKQLPIYKYYLEKQNPDIHIEHLKYIFIPKTNIRQKKSETIQQFRNRLFAEMNKLDVEIAEVRFDINTITSFLEDCKQIETNTEYPKNETRLCDWCEVEPYCKRGEDWIIYEADTW